MARSKKPSRAVHTGTTLGTVAGVLIEAGAAAAGMPLPPGTGAAVSGALAGLFAYFTRGGRKGETD